MQGKLGLIGLAGCVLLSANPALAIDVKLSMDDAQKALEAGRAPMEKANTPEEVKKVLQQASMVSRVGADPEKDPCGASAVLRTKLGMPAEPPPSTPASGASTNAPPQATPGK